MKLLALDLETSPNVAFAWGLFDQNIGITQLISTTEVLCFSAMWVGEDKGTYPDDQRPKRDGTVFYGGLQHSREEMLAAAHDLLDQADSVLHYNGKRFDIPHLNREFLEAGMPPPSPYQQIDLLLVARANFRFVSNKLDHVTQELGLEGKVAHEGFGLWRACLAGILAQSNGDEMTKEQAGAWKRMEGYNRRDVTLLRDLYEILLPWIKGHPNRALHDHRPGSCPKCGDTRIQRRGTYKTLVSEFPQFQCQGCGGWFRGTKREHGSGLAEAA